MSRCRITIGKFDPMTQRFSAIRNANYQYNQDYYTYYRIPISEASEEDLNSIWAKRETNKNKNSNISVKNNKNAIMAPKATDHECIKNPNTDIPDLPRYPYYKVDLMGLTNTNKANKIQKLQNQYDTYHTLRNSIRLQEYNNDKVQDQKIIEFIQHDRNRLYTIRLAIDATYKQLEQIDEIQEKITPILKVYTEAKQTKALNMTDMKEFMTQTMDTLTSEDESKALQEIWTKLSIYAKENNLSYKSFKTALISCTTGEVMQFISDNYDDLTLVELSKQLADRFVTGATLTEATYNLEHFKRKLNEPITQAVARLQSYLRKALITHTEEEKKNITRYVTISKIKDMVAPKTKQLLDQKEQEAILNGSQLYEKDYIKYAESEERRSGRPKSQIDSPVTINNAETQHFDEKLSEFDSKLEKVTDILETFLLSKSNEDSEIDVNIATKSTYAANNWTPNTSWIEARRPRSQNRQQQSTPDRLTRINQTLTNSYRNPSSGNPSARATNDSQNQRTYNNQRNRSVSRDANRRRSSDRGYIEHNAPPPSASPPYRQRSQTPTEYYKGKAAALEEALQQHMKKRVSYDDNQRERTTLRGNGPNKYQNELLDIMAKITQADIKGYDYRDKYQEELDYQVIQALRRLEPRRQRDDSMPRSRPTTRSYRDTPRPSRSQSRTNDSNCQFCKKKAHDDLRECPLVKTLASTIKEQENK
jgi:hypothetical protein